MWQLDARPARRGHRRGSPVVVSCLHMRREDEDEAVRAALDDAPLDLVRLGWSLPPSLHRQLSPSRLNSRRRRWYSEYCRFNPTPMLHTGPGPVVVLPSSMLGLFLQ
jgi:hypothetical protein